jgi:hypothetical protein
MDLFNEINGMVARDWRFENAKTPISSGKIGVFDTEDSI